MKGEHAQPAVPSRVCRASPRVCCAYSWVPWLREQLARGIGERELQGYLEHTLPSNSERETQIDTMLKQARGAM